jgi:hypothetical protein
MRGGRACHPLPTTERTLGSGDSCALLALGPWAVTSASCAVKGEGGESEAELVRRETRSWQRPPQQAAGRGVHAAQYEQQGVCTPEWAAASPLT